MFWVGFIIGYIVGMIICLIVELMCMAIDKENRKKWMEDDDELN